jgi:hypothetical protein
VREVTVSGGGAEETGIREALAVFAALVAVLSTVRGPRRLGRGLGEAVPLEVVRGLRSWAVAIAAVSLAVDMLSGRDGVLVFGAVFLAEELDETAVLAAVLRRGRPVAIRAGRGDHG